MRSFKNNYARYMKTNRCVLTVLLCVYLMDWNVAVVDAGRVLAALKIKFERDLLCVMKLHRCIL